MRTLMQRAAPVETHGRVFALDGMVHSTGDLVSLPLVGLAAGLVGVQAAGVAMAAVPLDRRRDGLAQRPAPATRRMPLATSVVADASRPSPPPR